MLRHPALLLAPAALVLLAACDRKAAAPTSATSESVADRAGPQAIVSGARLVLPAVSGNPAALYLTLANAGTAPLRLTGLAVAGASSTELHQTLDGTMAPLAALEVAPASAASLAPGARHAMVMGLNPAPKPGDRVAVTLKFADGSALDTTARAEPAGGTSSMDAMPGMSGPAMAGHDMGKMH